MEKGLGVGKCEMEGLEHGVGMDLCGGGLEWPGVVIDFAAEELVLFVGGVEAVAFGEEVFEGVGRGGCGIRGRLVLGDELGRLVGAGGGVVDGLVLVLERDTGEFVVEVEPTTGYSDGEAVVSIE